MSRIVLDAHDADIAAAIVLDQADRLEAEAAASGNTRSAAAHVRRTRHIGREIAKGGTGIAIDVEPSSAPIAAAPAWSGQDAAAS